MARFFDVHPVPTPAGRSRIVTSKRVPLSGPDGKMHATIRIPEASTTSISVPCGTKLP